jgi:hypothetical protein
MSEQFYLGAYWGPRRESVEDCASRVVKTLHGLRECDEAFSRWYLPGKSRSESLLREVEVNLDRIATYLASGQNHSDDGKDPIADLGFRVSFWNGGMDGGKAISLSFHCGSFSKFSKNSVVIDLPWHEDCASLLSGHNVSEYLSCVAKAWLPDWATFTSPKLESLVQAEPGTPRFGWLTYVNDLFGYERVASLPKVQAEPLGLEGKLYVVTKENFSSENTEQVSRIRGLRAAWQSSAVSELRIARQPE